MFTKTRAGSWITCRYPRVSQRAFCHHVEVSEQRT